ncbi:copper ion binding protein [Paenibacillus sp. SEL3]|jgi:copper chaperone|uniref:Heavy-metal-associated domain-containing protein n=1 Tax=Paenibacillus polymyxa TaxID=1406 RepID=A0A8I1IUF0_PAEPO|nr:MULTISPECIES: copper ion binding protein [Paenibacillus]KAF6573665.1 heavy-metal-associated domain-containing protein [Paenibacillus sp. EKM206P]KAF6588449.1 heavy-metal-associated domain-containing protein [Paenibacillus sp. EKM205P]MBM0634828.1 heavy-metal-associated domain-containing protein [Paenibacillus polymyxa]
MAQVTLNVEGMSCNHCVKAVEGALEKVGATGKVSLEMKQVNVEYDESKLNVEALKTAIEDQGYDVV